MSVTKTQLLNATSQLKQYIDTNCNYSLDEQQIGTWIDGRPLYQKTIKVEIPTYDGTENWKAYYFPINVENIDWINLYSGTLQKKNTGTVFSLLINSLSGESYSISTDIENNNVAVYVGKNLYQNTYAGYITIQYTKNTDVAEANAGGPNYVDH